MKKSSFLKSSNIVLTYIKLHWKLVLFCTIAWTVIIIGSFMITLIGTYGKPVISNGIISHQTIGGGYGSDGLNSLIMFFEILFRGIGIAFYGMLSIIIINKILIKEASTTQISLWLTQPISRTWIIISKLGFLYLVLTVSYLPPMIVLTSFAASAHDASVAFKNIFLSGIQIYIFQIMVMSILFVISLVLIERVTLVNTINSTIIFYILLISFIPLIIKIGNLDIAFLDNLIKFSPLSFMNDIFESNDNVNIIEIFQEILPNGKTKIWYVEVDEMNINALSFTLKQLLMVTISFITVIWSIWLFKNKSFAV